MEYCIKAGAHRDKDPATKATHVKPADDSSKLLLQNTKFESSYCLFSTTFSTLQIRRFILLFKSTPLLIKITKIIAINIET